jgi:hypothetical protein
LNSNSCSFLQSPFCFSYFTLGFRCNTRLPAINLINASGFDFAV